MNLYNFNSHGVCINPNSPVSIHTRNCSLVVYTAQLSNGMWNYGFDLDYFNAFCSRPVVIYECPSYCFYTESLCIIDCLDKVESKIVHRLEEISNFYTDDSLDFESHIKHSTIVTSLNVFLEKLRKYKSKFDYLQLSLF